jgi:hypothetical protein
MTAHRRAFLLLEFTILCKLWEAREYTRKRYSDARTDPLLAYPFGAHVLKFRVFWSYRDKGGEWGEEKVIERFFPLTERQNPSLNTYNHSVLLRYPYLVGKTPTALWCIGTISLELYVEQAIKHERYPHSTNPC